LTELELPEAELSILFVGDERIRVLNRQYLQRDKPTNVLAFPMREGEPSGFQPNLLGDLVISVETAKRQSKQFGLNEMSMVTLLMIHGILHLLGYDHERSKKEARQMALKQKQLLQKVLQK
jgi:probable rRNA maturation factor